MEESRQAAVAELRKALAAETAEALRVQDEEIGLLIARLQVSVTFSCFGLIQTTLSIQSLI